MAARRRRNFVGEMKRAPEMMFPGGYFVLRGTMVPEEGLANRAEAIFTKLVEPSLRGELGGLKVGDLEMMKPNIRVAVYMVSRSWPIIWVRWDGRNIQSCAALQLGDISGWARERGVRLD